MIKIVMFIVVIVTFTGCTTLNQTMREPNVKVNLNKSDFSISDQVTANATSTKIFGIDFARLFARKTGTVEGNASSINMASIPVIGNFVTDRTANYALYELMKENPGYDVVFYPQFEIKISRPVLGLGFILKITRVKTTARLGKLIN